MGQPVTDVHTTRSELETENKDDKGSLRDIYAHHNNPHQQDHASQQMTNPTESDDNGDEVLSEKQLFYQIGGGRIESNTMTMVS